MAWNYQEVVVLEFDLIIVNELLHCYLEFDFELYLVQSTFPIECQKPIRSLIPISQKYRYLAKSDGL